MAADGEFVVEVTRKLPGTPGVPGPVPPPLQDVPLMLQLTGSPVPAATNPNEVAAPAPREPFQLLLVAVTCPAEETTSASQNELMLVPAGRSNWTVQLEIGVDVLLVTVNLAS